MRFKYYLRGFGTGVLFATILLIIAFAVNNNIQSDTSKKDTSDNSVVLNDKTSGTSGLTFGSEGNTDDDNHSDTTKETSSEKSETTKKDEAVTGDNEQSETEKENETDGDSELLTVEDITTQQETTEAIETTTSPANEQPSVEPSTVGGQNTTSVVITIERGMHSGDAARLLAQFGLVDDAVQFDEFMETSGYASRLKIGMYEIARGASYEEIARIITQS